MNTRWDSEQGSGASAGAPSVGSFAAPLERIDDDTLPARIERLSPQQLDALPFGVVRLDAEGLVTFYSRTEGEQSGFRDRRAIGRQFFTQIAPCLSTPERLRRIEEARRAGTLDVTFEQIGDFDDADRELHVRVFSAAGGGVWVCLPRP
jgi:photoactive yellow protein